MRPALCSIAVMAFILASACHGRGDQQKALVAPTKQQWRTRPADSFKHPVLEAAWESYGGAKEKSDSELRRAFKVAFKAAAASGTLGDCEKIQAAEKVFNDSAVISDDIDSLRPSVKEWLSALGDANNELSQSYLAVSVQLAKDLAFGEAAQVEAERKVLFPAATPKPQSVVVPEGTLVRPPHGVEDAELDTAWKVYRDRVNEATQECVAAIDKQLRETAVNVGSFPQDAEGVRLRDVAIHKGEQCEAALEALKEKGLMPGCSFLYEETKEAVRKYDVARNELIDAYSTLVKSLTKAEKIKLARAAENERLSLVQSPVPPLPPPPQSEGGARRKEGAINVPPNAIKVGRQAYWIYTNAMTQQEASAACQKSGGRLARITERAQINVLNKEILPLKKEMLFWVDGTDAVREGTWTLLNGEPLNSERLPWFPQQPDDWGQRGRGADGLAIILRRGTKGEWMTGLDDDAQQNRNGYICEWELVSDGKIVEAQVSAAKSPQILQEAEKFSETAKKIFLVNLPARNASRFKDRKPYEEALQVRGVISQHGLPMHPPPFGRSQATYDVPKDYKYFRALAAINDSAEAHCTPVLFKVLSDGKTLWSSRPLVGAGKTDECNVLLDGVTEVTLVVECGDRNDWAHAVWIDPCFTSE